MPNLWTRAANSICRAWGETLPLAITGSLNLIITVYQRAISPLLGPRCRFYPSCSAYTKECLSMYPWPKALMKSGRRLLSCHPFHPGGVDLP